MGMRYVFFRTFYELKKRTGALKSSYPTNYTEQTFISLNEWIESAPKFFFDSKETLGKFNLSDDEEEN